MLLIPPPPMRKSSRQIASPRPRSRNHTLASSAPPAVKIRTHDMLNPQERRFLEAAEMGDRPTLAACLEQVHAFFNCISRQKLLIIKELNVILLSFNSGTKFPKI